jgi:PAS domain S-box-containing protein
VNSQPPKKRSGSARLEFLTGGGEMADLIRHVAWEKSPLGPIAKWPQSLRTSVSLMLNSQHPMWIGWGPEATFLYNKAYIDVLSLAKHPWALGRPASEVWAEIWDICGPLADKVFQNGEASFVNDVRLFMSRGDFLEETFYSFSYSPIRDESGKVGGLFCPSTEVTAKVLNTRRLRAVSELAAESLLERSTHGACASAAAILARNRDDVPFVLLYLIDQDGSAALEQAVGVTPGREPLSPRRVALDGAKPETCLWPLHEVAATAQSRVVSIKGLPGFPLGAAEQPVAEALVLPLVSRGQERPLGLMVAGINPTRPLDAEYRTFYELVAGNIATAIQNARATEEEKKRADMLAELDRAKTTFFSNVSHELRTPLTLILGPLEDELRESAAPSERLELAHRNSLRLLRLVNTLLDFSRIEAGRVDASFTPTDLAAFTAELASVFRSGMEKAGLRLIVSCPPLPEPVYVDREMWEKIVFNLLSNAFKFTAHGEIEVKLGETGPPDAKAVALSVRDTGTGIPAAELPRVFERFHRMKNSWARSHEGTGIGLALVQELAHQHGGSAVVESTEGVGTTFTVTIPLGRDHLPPERIEAERKLESTTIGATPFLEESLRWVPEHVLPEAPTVHPSGTNGVPPARILLADDNSDMRGYVQRLLAGQGYEVIAVSDGQAALEAARTSPPALVLSDVMMPRLDGFGLLRELRAAPATRAIPIIMLSARAGEEARVEGVEMGADDYLTKPFSARELLARVASHLELARVRRASSEAMHAATAKFQAIFEQSPIFAGIMDRAGTLLEVNRASLEICGFRAEEEIGRPFWETGWWRGLPSVQEKLRIRIEQAARGIPYLETLPYQWSDGTRRMTDFALHPIRDENGEILFLHPTGLDITERYFAQTQAEFLSQLTQKLSNVSDPIEINRVATQEIGQFLDADGCLFEQVDTENNQALVLPDWRRHGPGGQERLRDMARYGSPAWWQTVQRGPVSVEDVDTNPMTKSFAENYHAVGIGAYAIAPFVYEGRWVAAMGVISNRPRCWTENEKELLENAIARVWPLIERARVERALRESENALRAANAQLADKATHLEAEVQQRTVRLRETIGELESYSYSIAHDMRAPLRSLQGFSQILLADYGDKFEDEARGFLERISAAAGRMDRLIQDVLNYSRMARGEAPREVVDVEELLRGIIETYPMFAPDKAEIVLDGPFPVVCGNEAMLMQIFSNLFGNAVKFVTPGVKPRIRVRAEVFPDRVRFFVEDNGIGIPANQHEKIFGIFQKLSRDFDGTGIGLAIVKKAVERMDGRVGVESEPGRGSTFWIEMPRA